MNNMVRKLEKDEPIIHTQLDSIMSWVEREDPFRSWSRERIKSYFNELTKSKYLEKDITYDDQPHWNPSLVNDYMLVNFNVPKYLITNFDNLNRFKRVSRTSTMIHLIENYIRSEHQKMKEDDTLNLMIKDVEYRNRENIKREIRKDVREVRDEYEPPMIPITSDYDNGDWENDLMRL